MIQRVVKWPGQEARDEQGKIPTLVWYDRDKKINLGGSLWCRGTTTCYREQAEDNGWVLAKYFKLHLHPADMQAKHDLKLDELPPGVTLRQIYADFLRYLLKHTKTFFEDRVLDGRQTWARYSPTMEVVIAHPNGWGIREQAFLRSAAVAAGFSTDEKALASVRFVTEAEASVHFCIHHTNLGNILKPGINFAVCDAGGSTVDTTLYSVKSARPILKLEEKRASACVQAGAIFVDFEAEKYLRRTMTGAGLSSEDVIEYTKTGVKDFEMFTKRAFKDETAEQSIAIAKTRFNNTAIRARRGRMALSGSTVKEFFDVCTQEITASVDKQINGLTVPYILLVGGFGDSPYIRGEFKKRYEPRGSQVTLTNDSTSKAVADGAVIWSTLSSVYSRAPRYSFGTDASTLYNPFVHDRQGRIPYTCVSGEEMVSGAWSQIVQKGVALDAEVVCRESYRHLYETPNPYLELYTLDLLAYSGENKPEWALDTNDEMLPGFQRSCTVRANLKNLQGALQSSVGPNGNRYWTLRYQVCIRFGGTELEGYMEWEEKFKTRINKLIEAETSPKMGINGVVSLHPIRKAICALKAIANPITPLSWELGLYRINVIHAAAFGAEAQLHTIEEEAEDNNWVLARYFKLHLHPNDMQAKHELKLEDLPPGVSLRQIYSDFLGYLLKHTRAYFEDRIINGKNIWERYSPTMEVVIAHPNGWGVREQAFLRTAAVDAGSRLHFCIHHTNLGTVLRPGTNFAVCDAGGSTVDTTLYSVISAKPVLKLKEERASACVQAGAIFVDFETEKFLRKTLANAGLSPDDVVEYTKAGVKDFEGFAKRAFKDDTTEQSIAVAHTRFNNSAIRARRGRITLSGSTVKGFFDVCVKEITGSVDQQINGLNVPYILLVGGFGDSPYIRSEFKKQYEPQGSRITITNDSTSKAVADGAVIWSTLSSVSSRAPRYSFGTTIALPFLANVHRRQYRIPYKNARGEQVVSGGWSQIVQKGVALDSEVVCRRPYVQLHTTPDPNLELFTADLLAYSGENTPEWARDPFGNLASGFQEACTIRANLQHLEGALVSAMGKHGSRYWTLQFDICIRFGGTELESYLEWEENVGIFDSYTPLETDNTAFGDQSRQTPVDAGSPPLDAVGSRPELPVGVLARANSPFQQRHIFAPSNYRKSDKWLNLATFSKMLNDIGPLFSPLAEAINNLVWFIRAHEDMVATRREYAELSAQLEGLFKDLCSHFSAGTLPIMTTSMLNDLRAIQTELRQLYAAEDKDTISRLLKANNDLDKVMGCYRRIQDHLNRLMEAQLNKLNPSAAARYDSAEATTIIQRRQCTSNTREQVLSELRVWQRSGKSKMCWINGMAGTGKTTIANTLCSTLYDNHELGASFFCTKSLPECRNVKSILSTIAYQLARFSNPFRIALLEALERDPDVHTKLLQVQFERMILKPLQAVKSSLPANTIIVIDALDECENENGVKQICDVLLEYALELPVKFLISSRPESYIRERMDKLTLKTQLTLHELDARTVEADIKTYLQRELELIPVTFTEEQLAILAKRAGVLFVYAATVVRYIGARNSSERLHSILMGSESELRSPNKTHDIDVLYETILRSAFSDSLEPSETRRMKLVLYTVICAQEPLTIGSLAGLLNMSTIEVHEALRPLWSVLYVSQSQSDTSKRVTTLHASFPEYLLDSNRSKEFLCNGEAHNSKLAKLCLERIKRNKLQFNICNLETSYIFDDEVPDLDNKITRAIPLDLLYACKYWEAHLVLGRKSSELAKALHGFLSKNLLVFMEVLNLHKQLVKCIGWIENVVCWIRGSDCFKDVEPLAQDAQRFVAIFATNPISRSTPHLYVSMLASWPDHRLISKYYAKPTNCLFHFKGLASTERQMALLNVIQVHEPVYCVAFAPNGQFFVTNTPDNTIGIWDAISCQMRTDPMRGHSSRVQCLAIASNNISICSGSWDGSIRIWHSQNGQPMAGPFTVGMECGEVFSAAFSPNASVVIAGIGPSIYMWDTQKAFFPDGKRFVSCGDGPGGGETRIWDVSDYKTTHTIFGNHRLGVSSVSVSPNGAFIATGSEDCTVQVRDTETWEICSILHHVNSIESIAFSPDSTRLISGSIDNSVCMWEVQKQSGILIGRQQEGHSDWVRSVDFSPCGTYLASASDDSTVCIWNARSGRLEGNPQKGHKRRVLFIEFVGGDRIISASADRTICVWESETGKVKDIIHQSYSSDEDWRRERLPFAVSPDGSKIAYGVVTLASGHASGSVALWDVGSGEPLFDPFASPIGHSKCVYSVAISPNALYIVSGSQDDTIRLWDIQNGLPINEPFRGHTGTVNSVTFSPDCMLIASGSEDKCVRVWDVKSGQPIALFNGHIDMVCSVKFSPDGLQIASGSGDRSIRFWNAPIHKETPCLSAHDSDGEKDDTCLLDWEMDMDGWVRDDEGRLLAWVPPDLRNVLLRPQNTLLISRQGCIEIEFSKDKSGDQWAAYYAPS
ncbi:ATP binding [Rhizoctonia solani]|uniref:ATP binding n=1 Tax=Rhizoctonia solani TaxID=456999 RepID=A0A8H7IAP1_9AGAM|nr:ATP binding [Rhizoctonia solani]